jgi:hypothetical protein
MFSLLCLKEHHAGASVWRAISQSQAENLLSRHRWKFCKDDPKLTGPARPVASGFRDCDAYAVHLGVDVPGHEAGYYLLEGHFDPKDLQ